MANTPGQAEEPARQREGSDISIIKFWLIQRNYASITD